MNMSPDPQLRTLLDSRKFKAMGLAVILIGLPIIGMAVALAMGRATYDQFVELTKWAFASLAGLVAVFMGAVAHEDAAQKSNAPINAGGDVNITNPPPGGSIPPGGGGGTTVRDVPPPPPVATGLGSLAPTTRPVRGVVPAILVLTALAGSQSACTGVFKQDARTALDVEQAACILANIALDVPALRTICRISDALNPELEKLLAAGRKVAASKGAPVCRSAGVP